MASAALTIHLDQAAVCGLDLRPLAPLCSCSPAQRLSYDGNVTLAIADWREPQDPRELSEVPVVRLWHLFADQHCPWLPLVLGRQDGMLCRYVAMLVPHRFSASDGIQFDPEALELWITGRWMALDAWCRREQLCGRRRLEQMAAVLGFELDAHFWTLLDAARLPPQPLSQPPT